MTTSTCPLELALCRGDCPFLNKNIRISNSHSICFLLKVKHSFSITFASCTCKWTYTSSFFLKNMWQHVFAVSFELYNNIINVCLFSYCYMYDLHSSLFKNHKSIKLYVQLNKSMNISSNMVVYFSNKFVLFEDSQWHRYKIKFNTHSHLVSLIINTLS